MTSRGPTRRLRPLAAVAVVALISACSGGTKAPTVPSARGLPTTTAAPEDGSSSGGTTPLARALAYSQCMRGHGVANFPDPVPTPSGGYGFRTHGINPSSSAFQSATEACNALVPGGWGSTGKPLSPAEQQQWLDWAKCIRAHGMPDFADPTFGSGAEVHITQAEQSAPQMRSATDACKSQMPSVGGLGG